MSKIIVLTFPMKDLGFMLIKNFPQSYRSGKRWIWAQCASILPNIPKNLIVPNISGLTRVITAVGYSTRSVTITVSLKINGVPGPKPLARVIWR